MFDRFLLAASLALFAAGLLRMGRRGRGSAWLVLAGVVLPFLLLCTLFLVSDAFTGRGIDESVLYHLTYGVGGAGYGDFLGLILASFVFFAGGLALATYLVVGRSSAPASTRGRLLSPALIALAFALNPSSAALLGAFFGAESGDFDAYYRPPRIHLRPDVPRNLVFVYAEGLERTYFDEARFPGLIQGLRRLEARSTHFTRIGRAWGTGWTVAGMTASLCGIPLPISRGNSMSGMDRFLAGAVCLGDLLADAGYDLSFLGGAALEFAGKGKLFASHGFRDVRGRRALMPLLEDPDYTSAWGLYDDSLLEIAFARFAERSRGERPFGLFLLTLDTHQPRGSPSRSCAGVGYRNEGNPILDAVACSDRLLSAFVERILATPQAADTVIVVASDHLAMRSTAHDRLQGGERTNLLMILDPRASEPRAVTRPGTPLDIGPILLHALGFRGALGLGRDLLAGETSLVEEIDDFDRTLVGWERPLAAFWDFPRIERSVTVDARGRRLLVDGRSFGIPALLDFDGELRTRMRFAFDRGSLQKPLVDHVLALDPDRAFLWVDKCAAIASVDAARGVCVVAGKLGSGQLASYRVDGAAEIPVSALRNMAAASTSPADLTRNREALRGAGP